MYDEFERIVIVGGPRCGKTTLAQRINKPVLHTDDLILDDLYASGAAIAQWLDRPAPWVIEGVTTALALRAWLVQHSMVDNKRPCDCVLTLWSPLIKLTYEQKGMLSELREHWAGLGQELAHRGVSVRTVAIQRVVAPRHSCT